MEFNLETLKSSGAFTRAKVIPKEITWLNDAGKEFTATVGVRPMSFVTAMAVRDAMAKGSPDILTAEISAGIVDLQTGNPIFTLSDLAGNEEHGPICDGLGLALWYAIYEVNNLGELPDPKTSALTTNSGATSSSPASAEKPSRKRKAN